MRLDMQRERWISKKVNGRDEGCESEKERGRRNEGRRGRRRGGREDKKDEGEERR